MSEGIIFSQDYSLLGSVFLAYAPKTIFLLEKLICSA